MKTIADIKRAIVVGAKFHTMFHRLPTGKYDENGLAIYTDKDLGIREVSVSQSNSFAFKSVKPDGSTSNSWCDWPKKDQVKFIDEKSFQIVNPDGKPILTYTLIS